jgi:hypothetical protein
MKVSTDISSKNDSAGIRVGTGRDLSSAPRASARVFILLFSILYSLFSTAQVSATFKADSTHMEIGDYLNMKLVVNTHPDIVVDFPKFPGDSIGKISIIKKDKIDTAKLGGDVIYSQTITISAYEEGRYIFEPFKVYFLNKSTNVLDSAYTNAYQITVTTLPVDTTKPIKPIKALKVDYQLKEFYGWIIAGIILLIAAIIGFILYRKYKNKPAPVVARPRPKDPPHIWANKELRKLDSEKLWQKDQIKLYHSRLTDILRSYLEFRYDYYALESTTEEIQTELGKLDISMDASGKLMETLRLADFVKFAKMSPAPDANMKSMQNALDFIDITKQKPEEIVDNNKQQQQIKTKKKKR